MPFTSTSYENLKRRKDQKIVCRVCKQLVPYDSLICQVCEAPEFPTPDPEKGVLTLSQTFLRVAVMVLIFSLIVVFKQDIRFGQSEPDNQMEVIDETEFVPENPLDAAFEIHHIINVSGANVRAEPSIAAKRVTVLSLGTRVKALKTQNDWTQISVNGATGWVASRLLVTREQAVD